MKTKLLPSLIVVFIGAIVQIVLFLFRTFGLTLILAPEVSRALGRPLAEIIYLCAAFSDVVVSSVYVWLHSRQSSISTSKGAAVGVFVGVVVHSIAGLILALLLAAFISFRVGLPESSEQVPAMLLNIALIVVPSLCLGELWGSVFGGIGGVLMAARSRKE